MNDHTEKQRLRHMVEMIVMWATALLGTLVWITWFLCMHLGE